MKRRRMLFMRLSEFRLLTRKLVTTLIVLSAFCLIILSKADNAHLNKVQDVISGFLNPVIHTLELPIAGVRFVYGKIGDVVHVYQENQELKKISAQVDILQTKLEILQTENEGLKKLLHYTPPKTASFVTAKVIFGQGDGFVQSLTIYTSLAQNLKKGQAVLYEKYLIGRIDKVMGRYAKVLLMTDINSKIPIFIKSSEIRGILSGNNTPLLDLLYTSADAKIKIKDKVVTSGIGGIFPSGIEIGEVVSLENGQIKVKPSLPLEAIEYVRVVDYGLEMQNDAEGGF